MFPFQPGTPGFSTLSAFPAGHTHFLKPKTWAAVILGNSQALQFAKKDIQVPQRNDIWPKGTALASSLTGANKFMKTMNRLLHYGEQLIVN